MKKKDEVVNPFKEKVNNDGLKAARVVTKKATHLAGNNLFVIKNTKTKDTKKKRTNKYFKINTKGITKENIEMK